MKRRSRRPYAIKSHSSYAYDKVGNTLETLCRTVLTQGHRVSFGAALALVYGHVFRGEKYGSRHSLGEAVFCTGMTGCQQPLSYIASDAKIDIEAVSIEAASTEAANAGPKRMSRGL